MTDQTAVRLDPAPHSTTHPPGPRPASPNSQLLPAATSARTRKVLPSPFPAVSPSREHLPRGSDPDTGSPRIENRGLGQQRGDPGLRHRPLVEHRLDFLPNLRGHGEDPPVGKVIGSSRHSAADHVFAG